MNKKIFILFFFIFLILFQLLPIDSFAQSNTDNELGIKYKFSYKLSSVVNSIEYSNSRQLLIGSDTEKHLMVWNITSNESIYSSIDSGASISVSKNANFFSDGQWIHDLSKNKKIQSIYSSSSSWSLDTRYFSSVRGDQLTIWNTTSWIPIFNYSVPFGSIIKWSPNGEKIVILSINQLEILDGVDYHSISTISLSPDTSATTVVIGKWTDDSRLFFFALGEYHIYSYNMSSYKLEKKYYGLSEHVQTIELYHEYIIAGTINSWIYFWKYDNTEPIYHYQIKDTTSIRQIKGLSEKYCLAITFTDNPNIEIYALITNKTTALAGDDILIPVDTIAYFNGEFSIGNILYDNYTWYIIEIKMELIGPQTSYLFSNIGIYHVTLNVIDVYGQSSNDSLIVTVYDPDRIPVVTILKPKDEDTVNGIVAVEGTASDPITIEYVEVQINNGQWNKANGTYNWNYLWDTMTYDNALFRISARAFNGYSYSHTITIEVLLNNNNSINNNKKPTIYILNPTRNSIIKGNIKIQGLAYDDTLVRSVIIIVQGAEYPAIGTNTWFKNFDTNDTRDGVVIIGAYAIDEFGLHSDIIHVTVFLNNTGDYQPKNLPPTIQIINPLDGSIVGGMVYVSGIAHDDNNNLLVVQIKIGNSFWHSIKKNQSDWNMSLSSTDVPNGHQKIFARCFDGFSFSGSINVTVFVNNTHSNNTGNIQVISYPNPIILFLIIFLIISIILFIIVKNNFESKRTRRKIKKISYPFIFLIFIILIISSIQFPIIIYKNTYNGNSNNNISNNTTIPSIFFYSTTNELITNENLVGHITIIEIIQAETDPGYDLTQQLKTLKMKINDPDIVFLTIDVGNLISKTDFEKKYHKELNIDWPIGFDIGNVSKELNITEPFTVTILKQDGSKVITYLDLEYKEKNIIQEINDLNKKG